MDIAALIYDKIKYFTLFGYWLAFFISLLANMITPGIIIPFLVIIIFMGFLVFQGYYNITALLIFLSSGGILGYSVNYYLGIKYFDNILNAKYFSHKKEKYDKAIVLLKKHGFIGLFMSPFRIKLQNYISFAAGNLKFNFLIFFLTVTISIFLWNIFLVSTGYLAAAFLGVIGIWLSRTGLFFSILFLLFTVLYFLENIIVKKGRKYYYTFSSILRSIKKALKENEEVKDFINSHPKFFLFIKRRTDKSSFTGLPLTLLFIALIYALALFGGIVENLINSQFIVNNDKRIANLLTIFRSDNLNKIFFWITVLGKWQIITLFSSVSIVVFWIWNKQKYIMPFLISITGSVLFTYLGKIVFHRARPSAAIYAENSFSFPSGHATIAVSFYGFLAYFLFKIIEKRKSKINIFFITFITIFLIGFSRLYLGVHYFSDVWAGFLAGTIWLLIAIVISEYIFSKKNTNKNKILIKHKKYITTTLIVITLLLYFTFAYNYQPPGLNKNYITENILIENIMDIFKNNNLRYTETLLGRKQEAISFIILSENNQQLINLFQNAGWQLADKVTAANLYKAARAALYKKPYITAPMTPDFWNSKVHDFGFEKSTSVNNIRQRHHARFWKSKFITEDNKYIYLGTASFDTGIKWGITHKISPDLDKEREFLFDDLQQTSMLKSSKKIQLVEANIGSNFSGDLFFTDGKCYILTIK